MIETIKLHLRYPQSRADDVTDAFTRGVKCGKEISAIMSKDFERENSMLRELVRELHSLYVMALDDCESMDQAFIDEYSRNYDTDLARSKGVFDDLRHRLDDAMRELGIEVSQ